jgi:hypothetical protein
MCTNEALKVRSLPEAEHDATFEQLAQYARVQSPFYAIVKEPTAGSLPCIDQAFEHMIQVVALTQEKGTTITRLFGAIQRWAIIHPGWDPAAEMTAGSRLVC